ncbi:DUF2812 domain-containing protein [Clostridium sp. AN503]|uniref:DUF2812 domain-containing protein n=1 Tax=Clostridium sp. AN503 TaxID=3160598 RepID=UPI00345934A2
MKVRRTIRLMLFREYETAAFAEYLEEMAGKGWYLKKIYSNSVLCFERGEPRRLTFSVAVLPDSSGFDSPYREEAVQFREFCQEAGWKLQYGGTLWQVFYSEKVNPLPLETDPFLQLTTQEGNSLSLGKWAAVLALSGLFLLSELSALKDPGRYLASPLTLRSMIVHLVLAVIFPAGMLYIWFWYKRARRCLEQGRPVPVPTLQRVKLRNGLWSLAAIVLIISIFWSSGISALTAVIFLGASILAVLIAVAVLTWVQEHGSGDRREAATGYAVGSFIIIFLMFTLVTGVMERFLPDGGGGEPEAYVRKEPFPVTFEELGYEVTEEWHRESEETFLAFYQTETGVRQDEDGQESHLTMTYYKSPVPAIIAGSKRRYPIDRGNVWEVTKSKHVGEDGVTVEHYRYQVESGYMMYMEEWDSNERDLFVISDRKRILSLEYSTKVEEAAVEAAITRFRGSGDEQ